MKEEKLEIERKKERRKNEVYLFIPPPVTIEPNLLLFCTEKSLNSSTHELILNQNIY